MGNRAQSAGAAMIVAVSFGAWGDEGERADICMAVGLDASGSIAPAEMRLQLDGLATTLTHPEFLRAVRGGPHGMMAIAVYAWSEAPELARVVVPWTPIHGEVGAVTAAAMLHATAGLSGSGSTGLAPAVADGAALLASCPWFADRQILNVVGDGITNIGPAPTGARDAALGLGMIINGLVVGGDPAVKAHFQEQVIGPQGVGFVEQAADYDEFAAAMLRKFVTEVATVE